MFGAGLGKYQIFSARGAAVGERGFVDKVTLIHCPSEALKSADHTIAARGAACLAGS